ncbi:MAG: TonB-dependent receptor [Alistipes sp.]|nr:TonB-dependent receptor [Alistipes sp.]MBQ1938614.1 TonB-dependent receptor [Alistipes sp.]MBQ5638701.1 TonB-dependent receptor [Alistipes sp.]MBR0330572.1 TonB-dependent receptor [Alistipes sp.]
MKQNSTFHLISALTRRIALVICMLCISAFAYAQSQVKGTVVDAAGEPIVGANVLVEGTMNGTTTGLDGTFTLSVPKGASIAVSFIGYKSEVVAVGSKTQVKVTLVEDAAMLDDVVVIGYGTVKKRDLTGAVTSVKSEDITIAPTSDVMEALQGKVAGMDITKGSGEVGSGVNVLLRGSRSIYGSNAPLFIIDGFPGSYDEINPSDIESIDVLKDASSTAIYGSAGANGVVIITTKRGKAGKATVNFDAYYGVSGSPNYQHGMVGTEWENYQREAYKYQNGSYPSNIEALLGNQAYIDAYKAGKWIDWVDEVAGNTAVTQKYSLSVAGGNDKTKVFSSISYNNDQGLLEGEERDQYALRLNIDQEIFSWAKAGFSAHGTFTDHDRMYNKTYTSALSSMPLGEVYNADGNLNHEYIYNQYTPLGDLLPNQFVNNTKNTYVNANAYLEIMPVKGLSIKSQISATLGHSRLGQFWGAQCHANRPSYAGSPFAQKTHNDSWGYTWENIAAYNTTIADDHNLGASVVTSWTKNQSEVTEAGGTGQLIDSWFFHNLGGATGFYEKSSFAQTQKMSYAVRLNYSYKGKYLLTLSNRWDGVSWFVDGEKWDSFPAAALAWRISDEGFMKGAENWLDNLKLRVSYGVTGNSGGIGAYATDPQAYLYPAWGISTGGTYVQFAQYTGTYGGSLTWEKSYNFNVGLDFGILNGRIDGSIDYFDTKTKGLLYKRQLPITSGITGWGSPLTSWQNLAQTSNHGIELTINARTIKKKNFSWNTALTFTWNKEQIDHLPEGDIIAQSLFEGEPIGTLYGYKYAGIWGTDADQATLDAYGVKPGFVKIETVEKGDDGGVHKYGQDDRMILGHTSPDFIIGLNNTFLWKGFDLTVYAMARVGQTISSDLMGWYTAKSGVTTNQLSGVDYWTESNQGAYYPRPGTGGEQSVLGSLSIVDGSFFKIKNITLGYTLPKSLTRKALMEKVRVYATAYNPLIVAFDKQLRETGADPETNGSDVFPTYRQFVFGLNITF